MVLGKLGDRCYWQICGGAAPRPVTSHHTPAIREVPGGKRIRLSREVTRGLREVERRRSLEVEESRARRRSANALRRPGSRCPGWLLALHEGRVSQYLVAE